MEDSWFSEPKLRQISRYWRNSRYIRWKYSTACMYCISILANVSIYYILLRIVNMWHDQGKWVTCRKFQFLFSYIPLSQNFKMLHFDTTPITIGSGYRVMKDLTMLKTIWNKGIWTYIFFANISKTTSPTSDSFLLIMSHIFCLNYSKQNKNIYMPKTWIPLIISTNDSYNLNKHQTRQFTQI